MAGKETEQMANELNISKREWMNEKEMEYVEIGTWR